MQQNNNYESKSLKIGYMDGYIKKYNSREDFVSDEAWQRFLNYKYNYDLKYESVRKKNFRAQKKISNFEDMVSALKNKEIEDAAKFLEVCLHR